MIERILNFYLKKVHPLRYAKRIGVSMGGGWTAYRKSYLGIRAMAYYNWKACRNC